MELKKSTFDILEILSIQLGSCFSNISGITKQLTQKLIQI